jgi:16S rRNA G966 N2-methylase RsmD
LRTLRCEEDVTLLRADVLRFLRKSPVTYDFIFADPPYALPQLEQLPDLVFNEVKDERLLVNDPSTFNSQPSLLTSRTSSLNPGGLFVLEHGKTQDFSTHPHFVEHRSYGSVNFSFFQ